MYFNLVASFESIFSNLGTNVVSFHLMSSLYNFNQVILIGYENGSIGVYNPGTLFSQTITETYESPALLLVFQAHTPTTSSPFFPITIQESPWKTIYGNVYMTEFFTIGNDQEIIHWGLRQKNENYSDDSEFFHELNTTNLTFDVDILGVS